MALPQIRLAGTFTCEPAAGAATYWLNQLGIPHQIQLAPYNQLFQSLALDEGLRQARDGGLSVILIRLEDWLAKSDPSGTDDLERVRGNASELVRLLSKSRPGRDPLLVLFCPPTPRRQAPGEEQLLELEEQLIRQLSSLAGVEVVGSSALLDLYPVNTFYDLLGDVEGHLPYTAEFFTAVGTLIARKAYALRVGPHKLLALDCDGTLWSGICAEDGPSGIRVEPGHAALQHHALQQRAAGMLVALCSKNLPEDVWAVLDGRSDVVLQREHLTGWRIGWGAKSAGLASLAAELRLGLDRVIFLDDNPLECAEAQQGCPETLVLQVPARAEELPTFLRHVWAMDHAATTREDQFRAAHYQQEGSRETVRSAAGSLAEFIARLELRLRITPPMTEDLERVAQLSQRVTQFNTQPAPRTTTEVAAWTETAGQHCLAVHVADRFGDYGLVGAMLLREVSTELVVESLLLSCRALGRGVEHRMLVHLGELAATRGLQQIRFPSESTPRNRPARDFLRAYCGTAANGGFVIDAATAATAEYCPSGENAVLPIAATPTAPRSRVNPAEVLARLAHLGGDVAALHAEVERSRLRSRSQLQLEFVTPRTPREQTLAEVAATVLGLDRVGVTDNLFELGAHSLVLVQISSRIRDALGVTVPFTQWFQEPTVAGVAAWLEQESAPNGSTDDHAALLAQLAEMSDEEAERLLLELEAETPAALPLSLPAIAASGSPAPAREQGSGLTIGTVGITTRNRPELVARCVASLLANTSQYGRQPELMVFDDSREPDERLSGYLRELGAHYQGPVRHHSRQQRRQLCEQLIQKAGAPTEIVQFALFGDPVSGLSLGANRNHMALSTAGRALYLMDDDIVAHPVLPPAPQPGCGFAFDRDPGEYWFFPDAAAEEHACRFAAVDILAAHERLLGCSAAEVLSDHPTGYPGDPGDHRIALTFSGTLGDCAWGSPFGFWHAPMGYLMLEGSSFDRLVASESDYRTACTSRRQLRLVSRELITDATFSMWGQLGLDNRQVLPPSFPVARGQDLVFGALMWQCLPDMVFGQLPIALQHLPEPVRRFWPGEITRTASGMDMARLVIECMRATGLRREEVNPGQGLRMLGERLGDLASLPSAEFGRRLLAQARHSNEGWLAVLEARLRDATGQAPYWEADVRRYIDLMAEAGQRDTYWVPLDLAHDQSPDTVAREVQRLIGWFGELLVWWPALVEAAVSGNRRTAVA